MTDDVGEGGVVGLLQEYLLHSVVGISKESVISGTVGTAQE